MASMLESDVPGHRLGMGHPVPLSFWTMQMFNTPLGMTGTLMKRTETWPEEWHKYVTNLGGGCSST
jgi:hypothetical protein